MGIRETRPLLHRLFRKSRKMTYARVAYTSKEPGEADKLRSVPKVQIAQNSKNLYLVAVAQLAERLGPDSIPRRGRWFESH